MVRRIDALFEIERTINGQSAEQRRAVWQELSTPLVADLEVWTREQRAKLWRGNDIAKDMDYSSAGPCSRASSTTVASAYPIALPSAE